MARKRAKQGRLGILVGGGPAPGINGVIGAATIEAINNGLEVLGIYDGFKWLANGDASHVRPLGMADVERVRFRGGSILNTSRENPTDDDHRMQNVVRVLRELGIGYLVTIGGDDTAYSASRTCHRAAGRVRVAHVPKTIDNDLPLPGNVPTFGFQTARHVGGRLVCSLLEDAHTTQRWYVVATMGRSAGHLALGMGTVAGATLTLIPEEFAGGPVSLDLICDIIEGAMIKARALGRNHGLAVIAEGVTEMMKEELKSHPLVEVKYDTHGHLALAEVPLALILRRMLQQRSEDRGEKLSLVNATIGYELRCADPIPWDAEYVQQLGWGAVRYLMGIGEESWSQTGAMISIQAGELVPIPFAGMFDEATGRTRVRGVNVNSDQYRCARSCMIRLERADFENAKQTAALAAAANLSPRQFRKQYAHVVGM